MSERKRAGRVHVDSGQILILDPVRLQETQYDSVARTPRVEDAAEVWVENEKGEVTVENFLDPPRRTNDGVVVDTGSDGSFSVWIEYGDDGSPRSIRIDLV
jgi:hypothetical protein